MKFDLIDFIWVATRLFGFRSKPDCSDERVAEIRVRKNNVNQETHWQKAGPAASEWTSAEAVIVARIMADGDDVRPQEPHGRPPHRLHPTEALISLQRRKARGIYRAPTRYRSGIPPTPPITDEWQDTPARHAARLKSLRRGSIVREKAPTLKFPGRKLVALWQPRNPARFSFGNIFAQATASCYYCGYPATTVHQVPPRCVRRTTSLAYQGVADFMFYELDCCKECNSVLGKEAI